MTLTYQALDGLNLRNSQVASIVGLTESHIGGIYGRDNNFRITVDYDNHPTSPSEWACPDTMLWAQLRNNYTTGRGAGAGVPAALEAAVDTVLPETSYGYRADDHEIRVLTKYAALHGYELRLQRYSGTSPSHWTDFVFLAPTSLDPDLIGDLTETWRMYWDGEVYSATLEADNTETEALSDIYGDDNVDETIFDWIREAVATQRAENRAAKQLTFA